MANKKVLLGLNIRCYSDNIKDNDFKGYLAGLFSSTSLVQCYSNGAHLGKNIYYGS